MPELILTIILIFMFIFSFSAIWQPDTKAKSTEYPAITIANNQIKLHIYLPDAEKGYYRGARFDWSGMISRIEYKGHTFFGEWRKPHNPTNHDDSVGPCEEFGMQEPLDYAQVRPGETFIKIGIGHLEKVKEKEYFFAKPYKIVKPGEWTVENGDDWIEFEQNLQDERGWGYLYTKRIQIEKEKPFFTIHHTLKNTGIKVIETNYYNHNFVMIDELPIGTNYKLRFSFDAEAK